MMACDCEAAGSQLPVEGSSAPEFLPLNKPHLPPLGPRFLPGFRMWKLQDLQVHVRLRIQPVQEDQIWHHLKRSQRKGVVFPNGNQGLWKMWGALNLW
jgi:hypothetical protein